MLLPRFQGVILITNNLTIQTNTKLLYKRQWLNNPSMGLIKDTFDFGTFQF